MIYSPLRRLFCSFALIISCSHSDAADGPQWLTYPGGQGPGKGKHIVIIAAEQEYRSEQSMPMMAKILSTHHGFECTVLFGVNDKGEIDPTMPVYPEKGQELKPHHIPGLEKLAAADLVIFFTRLLTLPLTEQQMIVKYIDSGKPFIALRTANHGFRGALPYKINDKQVNWGSEVLGGEFMGHHGNWHADSTRGTLVPEQKDHPILIGVSVAIFLLGGLDNPISWVIGVLYFICVHATLILLGVFGLNRAILARKWRFPLLGPRIEE